MKLLLSKIIQYVNIATDFIVDNFINYPRFIFGPFIKEAILMLKTWTLLETFEVISAIIGAFLYSCSNARDKLFLFIKRRRFLRSEHANYGISNSLYGWARSNILKEGKMFYA